MAYDPKASTHAQMVTRNMFQQLGSTYAARSIKLENIVSIMLLPLFVIYTVAQ